MLKVEHSTLTKFNDNLYYLSPNGLFGYVEEHEEFLPLPISSRMFENDFYVSGKMILDQRIGLDIFEKNIVLLEKNIFDNSFSIQKIPIHNDFRKTNLGFENISDLGSNSYLLGTMNGLTINLGIIKFQIRNFADKLKSSDLNLKEINLSLSEILTYHQK